MNADLIKPEGIYCRRRCPSHKGKRCEVMGCEPFLVCEPFAEMMKKSLKQVSRYCKAVTDGGTPGDYGCGESSTAHAVLDILEENNITMEQLK